MTFQIRHGDVLARLREMPDASFDGCLTDPPYGLGSSDKRARAKRDKLAAAHLPLVVSIARSVHASLPPSFTLDDLIAEGNVALLKVAGRYNPRAHGGTPFSAYARQSIRGAMIESCRRSKYTENTRPSIDEPFPDAAQGMAARPEGSDLKYGTEAARALARMATLPGIDDIIDRERDSNRLWEAIFCLDNVPRFFMWLLYGPDEITLRKAAGLTGISILEAEELHAAAIVELRARLTPGMARNNL